MVWKYQGNPSFQYKIVGNDNWIDQDVRKGEYRLPFNSFEERDIYTASLTNLFPGSTVLFRIAKNDKYFHESEIFSYRVPELNNIKLLVGGDVGNDVTTFRMHENTVE